LLGKLPIVLKGHEAQVTDLSDEEWHELRAHLQAS
jgi:hypothetical protein